MYTKLSLIAASLALLFAAGCGPREPTVQGTVTFNGEPVKNGSISFRPVDGTGPSFGSMIVDGKYSVEKNVRVGQKRVFISQIDESKMARSRAEADQMIAEAKAKGISVEEATDVEMIPPDAEGNNQVVEIKMGAQTLDFAIQSNSP